MPATKKKTAVKKTTYTTVGRLFKKMAKKAALLDYRVIGNIGGENPDFIGFIQTSDLVRFYDDGSVCVYDVGIWDGNQRVKVEGDIATIAHKDDHKFQFRFYSVSKPLNLSK